MPKKESQNFNNKQNTAVQQKINFSLPIKVLFAVAFVLLTFAVMFYEGLVHDNQSSKYSMALIHGAHLGHEGLGGGHTMQEADDHEEGMEMDSEESGHTHMEEPMEDAHDTGHEETRDIKELFSYAMKTPKDKIERLNFVEKDGVKEFQLTADEILWEYATGKFVQAWGYNGQVPGPEIRVEEGNRVRIFVKNNLKVPTTVHWHGLHIENEDDGIPGLTQFPIQPGEIYMYEFTAKNAGTHFYHSHGSNHADVVTQMDMGLSGAFIVEPKVRQEYDREYVYLFDEWAVSKEGFNEALESASSEVHEHVQHTYNVFTVNGRIFPDIEPLMVKEGDKVLIRMINAGTQEFHPMHTHGHSFKVVAIDGNPVPEAAQITRDTLTVNPGERYDVELIADNPGVWLFHCHQVHHASAGMIVPFIYKGKEPCCLEGSA